MVRPFARQNGLFVVAFPFDPRPRSGDQPGVNPPCHPECGDYQGTAACRSSWADHASQLRTHPEVHWHRCEFEKLCAVVPVVVEDRCVAACKLVCGLEISELEFGRYVEHLDVLVQGFVRRLSEQDPRRQVGGQPVRQNPPRGSRAQSRGQAGHGTAVRRARVGGRPVHGHVARALRHIHANLADPRLMVHGIARALELDANYLAHLFRARMGERMTWYISARRMELAQKLLAAASRMTVQQVTHEVGYTNGQAFSQAFRAHMGMSPTEYRRKATSAVPETSSQ